MTNTDRDRFGLEVAVFQIHSSVRLTTADSTIELDSPGIAEIYHQPT